MRKILTSLMALGLASFALTSCCCDYDSSCGPCPDSCWSPRCPDKRPEGPCPQPHFWNRCSSERNNYEY